MLCPFVGNARARDLLLRSSDPLSDGGFVDQEGARDLSDAETPERAQRQGDLGLPGEGGVAGFQGSRNGVLKRILGELKIAEDPDQCRQNRSGLGAEDPLQSVRRVACLDGLLRSLAVQPTLRRRCISSALVREVVARAEKRGLDRQRPESFGRC